MYCTIEDIKRVLPQKITIGDINIGTPDPGRPTTKRDNFTELQVISYINFAQQEIDSRLGNLYICPLRRIKSFETEMLESISSGSNVTIKVHDSGAFHKGCMVRLQDSTEMETATVSTIASLTSIVIESVQKNYDAETGRVSILEYPDPIPIIAARFAASYAFDELFSAEQAPNISTYGIEQRKLALNSLDSILSGTIYLVGQEFTGRRFIRAPLFDSYPSPNTDFQFGREKQ